MVQGAACKGRGSARWLTQRREAPPRSPLNALARWPAPRQAPLAAARPRTQPCRPPPTPRPSPTHPRAEALSSAGHAWVGTDISADMLTVGLARGTPGDTLLSDMGQGLPFRTGSFDGAISVSAVQWLCYATQKSHQPYRRIRAFFASLYRCLKRGARAALQIYPENAAHLEMLSAAAAKAGFRGGLVVDFPNSTKAKKYYLCLVAGSGERDDSAAAATSAAGAAAGAAADSSSSSASDGDLKHSDAAMEATDGMGSAMTSSGLVVAMGRRSSSDFEKRRRSRAQDRVAAHAPARKEWVLRKKEQRRAKGLPTRSDSKYTGRRRPDRIT